MNKRLQVYDTDDLVVTFDPNVCIHSTVCVQSLPGVFDVAHKRWIQLEKGTVDEIVGAVAKCPSGALRAIRAGSAPGVAAPAAARAEVTVKPNGPLLVRGPISVHKENGEQVDKESCALCRCGATKTAPFCDGSHNRIGFQSPS